ncbi:MAG TPA: hypothetical protein VLG14_10455 [Sphingomonas sp.]|nr:hypothetical protein [Sphingomonas sp.]
MAKEAGEQSAGGDFYGPFWSDAKDHVFGRSDLYQTTEARISSNPSRGNLYPQLRDGFLTWWNERRRWTNEPFRPSENLKGRYTFPDLDATIKVDNIMSVRDGQEEDHFIYPYFSPEPALTDEPARLGLWLLGKAIPNVDSRDFRLLDVIRGATFSSSPSRTPLKGDEELIFKRKYEAALREWDRLREEYN